MVYQTDKRMPIEHQHVGCAFNAVAFARELYLNLPWTAEELGKAWNEAIRRGLVSGDLNKSGILGDRPDELSIQNWQSIAEFLETPLRYFGSFKPGAPERVGRYLLARWYNPATKFTHFVVGDERPVVWDPIEGGSRTVREGTCVGLELFDIVIPSKKRSSK